MEKETGKTWISEVTYGDKSYYIAGNEYSAGEELDSRRSEETYSKSCEKKSSTRWAAKISLIKPF